jgi:hypothetical protein
MTTTPADFIGRTVDLSIFDNVPDRENEQRLLKQTLLSNNGTGAIVTGAQKVAQWFIARLFKIPGDDPYEIEGCTFLQDASQGVWQSSADVRASFTSALSDILEQQSALILPTDKADEVLEDAILENVELLAGYVILTIRVVTAAGDSRQIISPLQLVV